MLYHFHEGTNALQATKPIRSVYSEDFLNERTCQKWFASFKAGDFDLNERDRSGRFLRHFLKSIQSDNQQSLLSVSYNSFESIKDIFFN